MVPRFTPVLQLHPNCDPYGQWCTPQFRAFINARLLDLFGEQQYAYCIGDTVFVHPDAYRELTARDMLENVRNPRWMENWL